METIFNYLAENFDLPILDWIQVNLHCPPLDKIMVIITYLGDAGIFWIALALVMLLIPKLRRNGVAMAISLIAGLLLCNVILKPLCGRIRPYDYQLQYFGQTIPLLISAQHDFSFPSGHTIASFEAAFALFLGNKTLGIPALLLACCIAFSRLYLYVHYPTDVIASVILGLCIGFAGFKLARKIKLPAR